MAILNEHINQKMFFFFDIFLGTYRVCSVNDTFEYTFDDVRVDARCWFDMCVGNGFFAVHFQLIFVFNGVINVDVQKI